jgi:penicillin amidase
MFCELTGRPSIRASRYSALRAPISSFSACPLANASEAIHAPEYQNRGTENDLIVFGSAAAVNKAQTWDVAAPDGSHSPHRSDQLALHTGFNHKPL